MSLGRRLVRIALVAGATLLAALAGRSADWNALGEIRELERFK